MMIAARLIPAADRDAIVGDLFEEAAYRGLDTRARSRWMTAQCLTIAAGLTVERARGACSVSLAREVASGIAVGTDRVWHVPLRTVFTRAAMFGAGVLLLAYATEILVGALLRSAGL